VEKQEKQVTWGRTWPRTAKVPEAKLVLVNLGESYAEVCGEVICFEDTKHMTLGNAKIRLNGYLI
jgi:hypothetical protein